MFKSCIPGKATVTPMLSRVPVTIRQFGARPFSCTTAANIQVSEAIKNDHRKLETYYDQIINTTDEDTRTQYQNLFTWELATHSIGEELVVYPAFEKHLGRGKEMAEKDRAEHQVVTEKLKKFQNMKATDPDFIPTIRSLWDDLSKHIKEEENLDLPALEKEISSSDSESIAKSFSRTKMFVPSRAHPMAPRKPPFETVLGLLTAPIDRLGDIFRQFPTDPVEPEPVDKVNKKAP